MYERDTSTADNWMGTLTTKSRVLVLESRVEVVGIRISTSEAPALCAHVSA